MSLEAPKNGTHDRTGEVFLHKKNENKNECLGNIKGKIDDVSFRFRMRLISEFSIKDIKVRNEVV